MRTCADSEGLLRHMIGGLSSKLLAATRHFQVVWPCWPPRDRSNAIARLPSYPVPIKPLSSHKKWQATTEKPLSKSLVGVSPSLQLSTDGFVVDVRSINIPEEKFGHWYAVLSIESPPGAGPFTLSSLDKNKALPPFVSNPSVIITIKLFAKHKMQAWRKDVLIAQGEMQLDTLVGEVEVALTPTAEYSKKNPSDPALVFHATVFKRADLAKANIDPASLEVNPKLSKAMDTISLIVKVGMAFSGLHPIASAVMSLVQIGVSEFDALLKRNNSVLLLVEQLGQANVLVADWDDPSLVELRPNQERLSQTQLGKRLADESINKVNEHCKNLSELVRRLESNQHLDTQTAVFKVEKTVMKIQENIGNVHKDVTELYKDSVLNKLWIAKDAGSVGSMTCLEGTRVALLQQICDWALDPEGDRVLLLNGAAGMGKSAIAHTIAKLLESSGHAI
ncbi:hypothetical protein H0H92_007938, partial [Tricholoma furcatifolium]